MSFYNISNLLTIFLWGTSAQISSSRKFNPIVAIGHNKSCPAFELKVFCLKLNVITPANKIDIASLLAV